MKNSTIHTRPLLVRPKPAGLVAHGENRGGTTPLVTVVTLAGFWQVGGMGWRGS
jgi:hypothetical protein